MDSNRKLFEIFSSITDNGKLWSKFAARLASIELHSAKVLWEVNSGEIYAFCKYNAYLHNNNCKAARGQLHFDHKCVTIAASVAEGLYVCFHVASVGCAILKKVEMAPEHTTRTRRRLATFADSSNAHVAVADADANDWLSTQWSPCISTHSPRTWCCKFVCQLVCIKV